MAGELGATVATIGEIFSDRYRLSLPYFQRGYAWQEQHVARLVQNLREAMRGSHGIDWYPLGVIIVVQQPGSPIAQVTDGHQRLITLTILLAVLRDIETDAGRRARLAGHIADTAGAWRLTTAATAQKTLEQWVQADGATRLDVPEDDDRADSEENILANRAWLRRHLADPAVSDAERRRLADFVLERCRLGIMRVEDERAARLLFSTMHDTGLRPVPGDLMKAEVLSVVPAPVRQARQTVWESHEARLGRDGLDKLLRDIATIGTGKPAKDQAERALVEHFDLGDADRATEFVDRRLAPLGDWMAAILEARHRVGHDDGGISRRMEYLNEYIISHDTWRAPLLCWLDRHGADQAATAEFLARLEPRAFVSQLLGEDPQRREARYMALITEIQAGTALAGGQALAITDEERGEADMLLTIDKYLRRRNTVLLLRLNGAIEGDRLVSRTPRATTEHVFPKNPRARSQWQMDFAGKMAVGLRNSLGNLTLLTDPEQQEAQNKDWSEKRPVLARSEFAISRRAAERATWRPADIQARTRELRDVLLKSWGLATP